MGEEIRDIDVDKVIDEIEKKIAELEGSVPEQQVNIMKDELNLLKMRKERCNVILGQEDLTP